MKAQTEIIGLLVIVIVLTTAGLAYLTASTVTDDDTLNEAEKQYLETFTTTLTEASACQGAAASVADVAAATLYNRDYQCNGDNAPTVLEDAVNQTILNETLDYQFGNQSYTVRLDATHIDNTITYRSCPPISESDRRAETQPIFTEYGGMRITLILCTG